MHSDVQCIHNGLLLEQTKWQNQEQCDVFLLKTKPNHCWLTEQILNKPWVTEEIQSEKKTDLENDKNWLTSIRTPEGHD
jgi:hypothetical protein